MDRMLRRVGFARQFRRRGWWAKPTLLVGWLASWLLIACAPAAAPSPTAAPTKPAAEATKPAAAAPTAAPAPKPTEAPAAGPAAKPGAFDEAAVADFYRGKTVRLIVGFAPGGSFDVYGRMLAKQLPRYIPGNPNVIVENKPGAATIVAANAVYTTEPKDGTVVGYIIENTVLQQAIGNPAIQFDLGKFHWLASTVKTAGACAVRTDSGINSIQDIMNGKEVAVGATGAGSLTQDIPATLKAAIGANFKIVTGYEGTAKMRLALDNKEVDGNCFTFDEMAALDKEKLEGNPPFQKIIVVMGDKTPDHPALRGVPAAETLAKTEDARQLLKTVHAPAEMTKPWVVAPEVPAERVEALRKGFWEALNDKDFRAEAERAGLTVDPSPGEEVSRIVQTVLNTQPATIEKLKEILK